MLALIQERSLVFTGVGGIAGDSGTSDAKVTGCYNTGDVKGVSPSASFKDTNAKGIGGIIGGVGGTSYQGFCFRLLQYGNSQQCFHADGYYGRRDRWMQRSQNLQRHSNGKPDDRDQLLVSGYDSGAG